MNQEQFDRIEAYLQNGLSSSERQTFEAELKTNVELRVELEIQRQLRLGLRAIAIEKQILAAKQRTQVAPKETIVRQLGNWQNWGLAASVAVMIGAGWLVWQYNQTADNANLKGLAEQEMTDVRYKSMPFDSLQGISNSGNSVEARQKAEWYVALAYMHKGQQKKAKALLTKIAGNPAHTYQQKAEKLLEKGFD